MFVTIKHSSWGGLHLKYIQKIEVCAEEKEKQNAWGNWCIQHISYVGYVFDMLWPENWCIHTSHDQEFDPWSTCKKKYMKKINSLKEESKLLRDD